MAKRKLPSFIDAFVEFHEGHSVPRLFSLWSAIWTISAAVERRVYCWTLEENLYPSLYIFLVAPPGIGKGAAVKTARTCVASIGPRRLGMSNMTAAFIADCVKGGARTIINPTTQLASTYNAINFIQSDLQTLLPSWDPDIAAKLTVLYDCADYSEGRRGGDTEFTFDCDRVFASMLAATTPGHLFSVIPDAGWSHGIMARTIMVYSAEPVRGDLVSKRSRTALREQYEALIHDIKIIAETQGEFTFTPGAYDLMDKFFRHPSMMGGPPIPSHPRLIHYCTRRPTQLEKLMIISSLDRGEDKILNEWDYERAYDWLITAEDTAKEIFRSSGTSNELLIANDLLDFLAHKFMESKGEPLPMGLVTGFLTQKMQSAPARSLFTSLCEGGYLKKHSTKHGVMIEPLKGSMT